MMDLLPPDLAKTIRAITDTLAKHTQGLILMRIRQELKKHPTNQVPEDKPNPHNSIVIPTKAKPKTDNVTTIPKTHTPDGTKWTTKGYEYDGPTPGKSHDSGTSGYGPQDFHYEGYDVPSVPDVWPPKRDTWGTGEHQETTKTIYDSPGDSSDGWGFDGQPQNDTSYTDAYIEDIFSAEPEVEIEIAPTESLVDLVRKGYLQDDADIKEHYTTMMSQLSQRFFQVMTALAEDSSMLDYSNLMEDFDGTAVTTSDPNQQHLIDEICRNQVLYDQKLRQMNLTHTAEHTLVMTRAMTAAEGERERYLGEDYKTNMPTLSAGLSNDLLQKAREDSDRKYKEAAYNYYKYLDSATKYTNTMLNMKIDSAIAKAELANAGSDIFAVTPPPEPLPDNVDDNFDTVNKYQDKQQKMIDEQKKDSKKASELDDGININGTSSSSSSNSAAGINSGSLGGGNVDPAIVFKYLRKVGYDAGAACGIMGNIQQESGFNTGADAGVADFGLCQWTSTRQDNLKALATQTTRSPLDAGCQLDFLWQELQDYSDLLPSSLNGTDAGAVAQIFEQSFERAGVPLMEHRIAYAQGFFQQFGGQ